VQKAKSTTTGGVGNVILIAIFGIKKRLVHITMNKAFDYFIPKLRLGIE